MSFSEICISKKFYAAYGAKRAKQNVCLDAKVEGAYSSGIILNVHGQFEPHVISLITKYDLVNDFKIEQHPHFFHK